MNPIELLREDVDKDAEDAYLYRLRKNNILNWVDNLIDVNKYKRIIKECSISSSLNIESGIVRIDPLGCYIGHEFVPHILAGFSFYELSVIMRYEIIKFENEYGEVLLSYKDLEELKQSVYMYNKIVHDDWNKIDTKKLIHLEQTAEVLYYLVTPSIVFKSQMNGWCTLTFTKDSNVRKDYCTIFTEEQIKLFEKVNNQINNNNNK